MHQSEHPTVRSEMGTETEVAVCEQTRAENTKSQTLSVRTFQEALQGVLKVVELQFS
jgi:hypothetical protein